MPKVLDQYADLMGSADTGDENSLLFGEDTRLMNDNETQSPKTIGDQSSSNQLSGLGSYLDFRNPSSPLRLFIMGLGFFANSYDSFAMSVVLVILIHASPSSQSLPPTSTTPASIRPPLAPSPIPAVAFANSSSFAGSASRSAAISAHLGGIAMATMVGVCVGQLLMGAIANKVGKTRAFVATLAVTGFGALGAALARGDGESFAYHLIFFRFLMGLGIGGEYPLSAAVSAEALKASSASGPYSTTSSSSSTSDRGRVIGLSFAIQGVGFLSAPLVLIALLSILPHNELELLWRCILAFTALPCLIALPFRIRIHRECVANESLANAETDAAGTEASSLSPSTEDHETSSNLSPSSPQSGGTLDATALSSLLDQARSPTRRSMMRQHIRMLCGVASAWFLLDLVFYGNAMFSSQVFSELTRLSDDADVSAVYSHVKTLAKLAFLLASLSIPGYVVGIAFIDITGRKWLMRWGFIAMACAFLGMVALIVPFADVRTSSLGQLLFSLLYGLTFFFANAGPHLVTYVMAGEAFPRQIASLFHGMCAAAGKLGAIAGLFLFPYLLKHQGLGLTLLFCVVMSLVGCAIGEQFTVETKGMHPDASPSSSSSSSSSHGEGDDDDEGETMMKRKSEDSLASIHEDNL